MTHPAWYLIHSKPAQENAACAHLLRQGFDAFLPRMRRQVRHAGRWRERIEAMFPRYLFVRLEPEGQDWAPIRSTIGVSRLVRFGVRPAVVPEGLVEDLRSRADEQHIVGTVARADFQPGQRVRVIEGPFSGIEGIVKAKSGRERVDILLAIVGQAASVRISSHDLAPC